MVLTEKGVKPDPKKQYSIQSMSALTNKDEVRRVLGVVTYLSRFSEDFSTTQYTPEQRHRVHLGNERTEPF